VARIRVGISGWEYDRWQGDFYPPELAKRRRLEYVTRMFETLEVNGTFYSLKSPPTFERWYETAPSNFAYALRGSRYITHTKRLRDPVAALANFFASGVLRLEDKLGPLLWQCPPNMDWEPRTFEAFCEALPRDARAAARIGSRHDDRVRGRTSLQVDANRNLRHAFEIRDERMMNEDMIRSLRRHGHAFVVSDTAGKYPYAEDITAGFVYVRLHGTGQMYVGAYDDDDRRTWVRRIKLWAAARQHADAPRITAWRPPARKGRDVYVYFDNDAHGHAPFDALALAADLHVGSDTADVATRDGQKLPPPPRLAA
jgi:uncharacterized protein YecE (DUF72 family)